jgi:hypothetical protein
MIGGGALVRSPSIDTEIVPAILSFINGAIQSAAVLDATINGLN